MDDRPPTHASRRARARRVAVAVVLTAAALLLAGSLDAVAGRGHGSAVAGRRPGPTPTSTSTVPSAAPAPSSTTRPRAGVAPSTHAVPPAGDSTTHMVTDHCRYLPFGEAARPVSPPSTRPIAATRLVLTMRVGTSPTLHRVVIALNSRVAPCAVNSVYHLARAHFYDRTPCPRLVTRKIFVLQCGDPSGTSYGGPGYRFRDEVPTDPQYPAGTVAMATSVPNTNGSQFFIVYRTAPLKPRFSIIGHVVSGLATIATVARGGARSVFANQDGPPRLAVRIVSARATCGPALHPARCPVRTLPQ